jgi:hypothetical protein
MRCSRRWIKGERVAEAMPVGGSVLELGCGAGRMTRQLVMRVFADQDELGAALAEAGLRLDRWLDGDKGRWFVAIPT